MFEVLEQVKREDAARPKPLADDAETLIEIETDAQERSQ